MYKVIPIKSQSKSINQIRRDFYQKLKCNAIEIIEFNAESTHLRDYDQFFMRLAQLPFHRDCPPSFRITEGMVTEEKKIMADSIPYCCDPNIMLYLLTPGEKFDLTIHMVRGTAHEHSKFMNFFFIPGPIVDQTETAEISVVENVYHQREIEALTT